MPHRVEKDVRGDRRGEKRLAREFQRVGSLANSGVTAAEARLFLRIYSRMRSTSNLDFLYELVGPQRFFELLDVMSGTTVRIPRREETLRLLGYLRIFQLARVQAGNVEVTEELPDPTISTLASVFARRKSSIKKVISKIREILDMPRTDI